MLTRVHGCLCGHSCILQGHSKLCSVAFTHEDQTLFSEPNVIKGSLTSDLGPLRQCVLFESVVS